MQKQCIRPSKKQLNLLKLRLLIRKILKTYKKSLYKKNFFITYKKATVNLIKKKINQNRKFYKKNYNLKKLLYTIGTTQSQRLLFWYHYNMNLMTKVQNKKSILYKNSKLNYLNNYIFKHILQQRKKKFFIQYGSYLYSKKLTFYEKTKYSTIEFRRKKNYYKKLKLQIDEVQYVPLLLTNVFLNMLTKEKQCTFNVNHFMWLNDKSYENYLLYFFSHENEETDSEDIISDKTFFFNFKNKKLKVYRIARQTHWNVFLRKNINKRRYQNFLNNFLKKGTTLIINLFTIFTFKFKLSFNFWKNFTIFYKAVYQIQLNTKQIFQLPIHNSFWQFIYNYELNKVKINQKIILWQDTQAHIKKTFWMQQKRKIPKFLQKKQLEFSGVENCIQYDFLTNYFCIIKQYNEEIFTNDFVYKNKYLKLHGFKYKS